MAASHRKLACLRGADSLTVPQVEESGHLGQSEVMDSSSPPAGKPLPRVRMPNLHLDCGQDSNPCASRPLGLQSTHGSTVPRRFHLVPDEFNKVVLGNNLKT
ncbi:hypothetical protein E2C01_012136 [Portunus trituberculatus]|uniref:Uncharacterized protein n=1 Tax=Portunus trituberculatus TaxID=210409 RepID=A0A5B7DDQ5_PORTR|nr:hypothetical protein [Portunus trituberculatus]